MGRNTVEVAGRKPGHVHIILPRCPQACYRAAAHSVRTEKRTYGVEPRGAPSPRGEGPTPRSPVSAPMAQPQVLAGRETPVRRPFRFAPGIFEGETASRMIIGTACRRSTLALALPKGHTCPGPQVLGRDGARAHRTCMARMCGARERSASGCPGSKILVLSPHLRCGAGVQGCPAADGPPPPPLEGAQVGGHTLRSPLWFGVLFRRPSARRAR